METGTKAPRRRHADELKARVLAACAEPGALVAAVAQAHGLNADLVHKWRRGCGATYSADRPVRGAVTAGAEFIALALPATAVRAPAINGQPITAPAADIRIEWRRGAAAIAVSWPVSAAPECARWLLQCMGAK
jgi:transposase